MPAFYAMGLNRTYPTRRMLGTTQLKHTDLTSLREDSELNQSRIAMPMLSASAKMSRIWALFLALMLSWVADVAASGSTSWSWSQVLESASVHLERVVVDAPTWSAHLPNTLDSIQPHHYTVAIFNLAFKEPMVISRPSKMDGNLPDAAIWDVLGEDAWLDGHGLLRLQCGTRMYESFPYVHSDPHSKSVAPEATSPSLYLVPLTSGPAPLTSASHSKLPHHAVYDILRTMYSSLTDESIALDDNQAQPTRAFKSIKAALILRYSHPTLTHGADTTKATLSQHHTVTVLPEEAVSSCQLQILSKEEQILMPSVAFVPLRVYTEQASQVNAMVQPMHANHTVAEMVAAIKRMPLTALLNDGYDAMGDETEEVASSQVSATISFKASDQAVPCYHSTYCRAGSLAAASYPTSSSHMYASLLPQKHNQNELATDAVRLPRDVTHLSLARAAAFLRARGFLPAAGTQGADDSADLTTLNPASDDPNADLLKAIAEVKCHFDPEDDAAFLETSSQFADQLQVQAENLVDMALAPLADMFTNVFNGVMGGMMATILGTQTVTGASQSIVSDISRILPNHIRTKVPIMVAEIVKDQLPRHIAKATAERMTWILTNRMTKHMMDEVIPQVSEATARRVTLRVPKKVARMVTRRLSHMLIRSLTHSIVPALSQTLERSPLRESWCSACREHNKLCEYCWQTAQQLHSGFYYAGYYSTYYSDYYTRYFDHLMGYLQSEAREKEVEYEKIKDLYTVTRETK